MATNDIEIRVSVKNTSQQGLDAARRQARETGDGIARELSRAGERAGQGFQRNLSRHIGDGADKGTGFFGRLFESIADQAQTAADTVGKIFAQVPVAISGLATSTVATSGINLLILALLGMVAAATAAVTGLIALAPALYLIGGAFGSAATAGIGLASVIGTLVVGLGGLGDAWSAYGQDAGGGGRSAADAAYQVQQATLALADAQREALEAQEAISRARMDEQERLEDLSRSLKGARLDEEGAVLAVQRAEQRLREARRGGSALDIKEAELAYRQAIQTLTEVQDRVGDLAAEQADADKKGVEGSDRVQQALRRQEQAQRQIAAATHALAAAQRGAGGGVDRFAEAMAKLSPNARSFMEALFRIREQFAGIKRETQDRLFEGLDRAVDRLANRSFPTLRRILGETADTLNGVFKNAMDALGDPEFLKNTEIATGSFNKILDRMGEKTVPKLLDALGRLGAASVPFWEELADMGLGWLEKLSDRIKKADKDGSLKKFFEEATKNLHKIREIGGTVLSIIGAVVEIFFPASERESEGFLDTVLANLTEVKEWLEDPANQQKIQDFIAGLQDMGDELGETTDKVIGIIDKIDGWTTSIDKFLTSWGKVNKAIEGAVKGGLWNPIKDGFKAALNWIIDKWNGLKFEMPSLTMFGTTVGGGSIGTINIPRLDHGGIAGGLVSVAERARELIDLPGGGQLLALPQGSMVHPNGATEQMLGGGGGGIVRVVIELVGADADLRRRIQRMTKVHGGGNVQVAFGDGKTR